EPLERVAARRDLEIRAVSRRQTPASRAAIAQRHDAVGLRVRQRGEQDCADRAEHGRARADAERDAQYRDRGKAWAREQPAARMTEIGAQRIHGDPRSVRAAAPPAAAAIQLMCQGPGSVLGRAMSGRARGPHDANLSIVPLSAAGVPLAGNEPLGGTLAAELSARPWLSRRSRTRTSRATAGRDR